MKWKTNNRAIEQKTIQHNGTGDNIAMGQQSVALKQKTTEKGGLIRWYQPQTVFCDRHSVMCDIM